MSHTAHQTRAGQAAVSSDRSRARTARDMPERIRDVQPAAVAGQGIECHGPVQPQHRLVPTPLDVKRGAQRGAQRGDEKPETLTLTGHSAAGLRLSVVIPTLNEQAHVERAVALARQRAVDPNIEIIVADCGSRDATRTIARRAGARVVTGPQVRTRARACNSGAAAATGPILLFLHADSEPPTHYDALIRDTLAGGGVGGAFEFMLDGPQWRLRVVEWVNRIRYRVRRRYFGDQGIFIRCDVFRAIGGFPDLDILEDARLCGRAKRYGAMRLITTPMPTSPRRFYNGGILTTLAMDVVICVLDWFGLRPSAIARHYRADNVNRGPTEPRCAQEPSCAPNPSPADEHHLKRDSLLPASSALAPSPPR